MVCTVSRPSLPRLSLIAATLICLGSVPVSAQPYSHPGGAPALAHQALAAWGYLALPNRAARSVSSAKFDGSRDRLTSAQVGGGLNPYATSPLYVELYGGYQSYSPVFTLSDGATTIDAFAKWRSVAVTGGFGWDFELTDQWTLRPIVNLSYGRVEAEVSTAAPVPAPKSGPALGFLANGELNTAGYGAALELAYKLREASREYDFFLRHTEMKLETIGTSTVAVSADVSATSAWARARYPIASWTAFGRPIRSVWQAGATALHGDQATALGFDWIVTAGAGIELDIEDTPLPLVKRARLMVGVSKSEVFEAYSIGLGISF
jgi:hypothetical protein